jgi:HhH-GPD superfamily base excision DNA repair protein
MQWMQDALLDWFSGAARDLPWRRTRDPYAILVSEVMLQQTQVARVLERYPAWLERWPTPAALAAAPAADVLRAWSGLGYNRRALNLQNAARRVVELGEFPREIAELERLPGIGPYTARAIACFAFDAQVTAPDTNCPARGQTFAPLRRQSRFEGSRRQRRAALVRELAAGPLAEGGYDRDVVGSLLADGLVVRRAHGLLALPEEVTAS